MLSTEIIRGNPQMLANLVILWVYDLDELFQKKNNSINTEKKRRAFTDTAHLIMGINTGSLIYAANSLGYNTGFCRCFQDSPYDKRLAFLREIGVSDPSNKDIVLGLGIGIPNENVDVRKDHFSDRIFKHHELNKPNILEIK